MIDVLVVLLILSLFVAGGVYAWDDLGNLIESEQLDELWEDDDAEQRAGQSRHGLKRMVALSGRQSMAGETQTTAYGYPVAMAAAVPRPLLNVVLIGDAE